MYVLIEIDELTKKTLPCYAIDACNIQAVVRYLKGYCNNKLKELIKKDEIIAFDEYLIEGIDKLYNFSDGYYFIMPNDHTVEIYSKKTGANGWIFSGEKVITKLYTIFYSLCDHEKSIMPDVDLDVNKKLHEELANRLKERRVNLI